MKHILKGTPVEHVCVPSDQPMSPKHFKNSEIGPGRRAGAIFPNIFAFYLEGSWHNLHSDVLVSPLKNWASLHLTYGMTHIVLATMTGCFGRCRRW